MNEAESNGKMQERRTPGVHNVRLLVVLCAFIGILMPGNPLPVYAGQEVGDGVSEDLLGPARPDLDQDPDIDPLLRNAQRYATDGRHRDAARLIQTAIDRSYERRSLLVHEGGAWVQIRRAVEQMLRTMDEQLLLSYQSLVEGEARALLGRAVGVEEEAVLGELQGRFFLSRHGDVAAFRLGVIYLDRYEFPQARAQFMRALDHPTPSVPRREVLKRLAAIAAFQGNAEALADYSRQLADSGDLDRNLQEVLQRVAGRQRRDGEAMVLGEWRMHYGTPSRRGHQPPLPEGAFSGDQLWTTLWTSSEQMFGIQSPAADLPQRTRVPSTTRPEMLERWRAHGWTPSSRLHFADDLVLFKTHHYINPHRPDQPPLPALVALEIESGELRWAADVLAPSALTDGSAGQVHRIVHRGRQQASDVPTFLEELLLFGDRIAQELTIEDGVVYTVEGHEWLAGTGGRQAGGWGGTRHISRIGGNSLAAIDLRTGKRLWRLSGDRGGGPDDLAFMAAPIKVGGRLFAPAELNDVLYLAAIDPSPDLPSRDEESRILFKTFLCATSSNQAREWAPVGIAADGSDIYVATGRGLVFAVSAVDGAIRWANEYEQSETGTSRPTMPLPGVQTLEGWQENVAFPLGSMLVVLPADAQRILLFDRQTGRLLDGSLDLRRMTQPDYMLGVTEDGLIAAGGGQVRRFELGRERSRQVWDRGVPGQTGRGVLAGEDVYLPSEGRVQRLRARDGRPQGKLRVALEGEDGPVTDPLGNIHSSGEHLMVTGMGRVFVLMDAARRLDALNELIAEGGADLLDSLESRAHLLRRMGRLQAAAADLREVIDKARAGEHRRELEAVLLDVLVRAAGDDAEQAEPLLAEARALARDAAQRARVGLALGDHHLQRQRYEEAFALYVEAAMGGAGIVVRSAPDQRLSRQSVALAATRKLDGLIEQRPELGERLAKKAQDAYEAARKDGADPERLLGIGSLFGGSDGGRRALLLAAEKLAEDGRIEQAESVLREAMRHDDAVTRITGRAALAALHEQLGWARSAGRIWKALESQGDGTMKVPWGEDEQRIIGELAAERLDALGQAPDAPRPGAPEGPWRQLWHERTVQNTTQLLDVGQMDTSDHLERLVLMPQSSGRPALIGRMGDGDGRWQLNLPDDPDDSTRILSHNLALFQGYHLSSSDGRLLRDGHIGFAVGSKRIVAYGLVRQDVRGGGQVEPLWTVNMEGRLNRAGQATRIQPGVDPFAVGSGVVAVAVTDATTAEQVVRIYCARTGHLMWERQFSDGSIEGVGVSGDYVVVVDGDDRGRVYHRLTGEQVGGLRLNNRTSGRPVVWTDHGVIYISGNSTVNMLELPSGKMAWRFDAGGRAMRLNVQEPGLLVVIGQNPHGVTVAELETGKRQWALDAGMIGRDFRRGVADAAVADDGSLVLVGANDQFSPQVMFIDAEARSRPEDGKVVVATSGGRLQFGNNVRAGWFTAPSAVVPRAHVTDQNRRVVEVRFNSRENGEEVEDGRVQGPHGGRFNMVSGPIAVVGGAVLISAQDGLRAYGTNPQR